MNLKTLREKIQGVLPLDEGERKEDLLMKWQQKHVELEALKERDERNYEEFEKKQSWSITVLLNKYDSAYLEMAEAIAKTSVAERLKVGCVIIRDGQPISLGMNGTPSGWYTNSCEDESGNTSWFTKHAEVQALNKLRKSTESSVGADMFITHSPCKMCALDIIDAGIKRVVFQNQYRDTTGIQLLKEHGVIVEQLTVDSQN